MNEEEKAYVPSLTLEPNAQAVAEAAEEKKAAKAQAEAENMMLKTCFDTVYQILEMRDEVSFLNPAFNCVCEVNPETCMAEIHCYYALLSDVS